MSVGRSVGRSICPYVFSRTVAVVYMYIPNVDTCMWVCAQYSKSGGAVFKKSVFMAWAKILYSYYTRCALIRDRQPTWMALHIQKQHCESVYYFIHI